jgi:HSP20 family protein
VPTVELIEKEGRFEMKFGVAGVNPDDVNVMVAPDQVVLRSEYSHQHEQERGTVHLCDFKSATVFRSVNLPAAIDVNSVKIDFADGMVLLSASKQNADRAEPKRGPARKPPAAKKSRPRVA